MHRPLTIGLIPSHQRADAILECRLRLPAQQLLGLTDLCPCGLHVGWMTGCVYDLCLLPEECFDKSDCLDQDDRRIGAEVNDLIPERFEAGDRASRDIVYVGEVPGLPTVAIHQH